MSNLSAGSQAARIDGATIASAAVSNGAQEATDQQRRKLDKAELKDDDVASTTSTTRRPVGRKLARLAQTQRQQRMRMEIMVKERKSRVEDAKLVQPSLAEISSDKRIVSARASEQNSSNSGQHSERLKANQIGNEEREEAADGNGNEEEPLIHTDKLNASSQLLFVFPPLNGPQRRHRLAANGKQSEVQAESSDFFSHRMLESPQTRLDVLNLEVSSSTATLTWSLSIHPVQQQVDPPVASGDDLRDNKDKTEEQHRQQQQQSRSAINNSINIKADKESLRLIAKRDTIKVRAALRAENDDDEKPRETDEQEEDSSVSHGDDGKNRGGAQSRARSDQEGPLRTGNERSHHSELAIGGQRLQALSAPIGGHNRRPPTRGAPAAVAQAWEEAAEVEDADRERIRSAATTATSTSSPEVRRPQRPLVVGSHHRRRLHQQPLAVVAASSSQSAASEPPMIKMPVVPLNRITAASQAQTYSSAPATATTSDHPSQNNSSTTTSTSTTARPRTRMTTVTGARSQREPKSLSESTTESASTSGKTAATEPTTTPSTLSPADIARQQHRSTTTTTSSTTTAPPAKALRAGEPSKWLVRLRRFGSNEVDIVKIVVNKLNQSERPALRRITFKSLEPANGYEICVESASPNQQVGDKFRVLDANHFLKCHDTSDVQLAQSDHHQKSHAESSSPLVLDSSLEHLQSKPDETGSIRRMDVTRAQSSDFETDGASSAAFGLHQSASGEQQQQRLKSLCREFFTLSAHSTGRLNYGQLEEANSSSKKRPIETASTSDQIATSSPRRPKSLSNALTSHMELMEIDDGDLGASRALRASSLAFEMAASRPLSRLASETTGSKSSNNSFQTRISEAPIWTTNLNQLPVGGSANDYLTSSVLPIVGCVFALIFLVTLANIVLNAISCASTKSSSSKSAGRHALAHRRRRRSSIIGGGFLARSGALIASNRRQTGSNNHLGSFYSDSDHSGSSQSRIIGGVGEPFASTAAYFEVPSPMDQALASRRAAADRLKGQLEGESSSLKEVGEGSAVGGSGRRAQAAANSYLLLSSGARFPLGPSFEGDEKHNADMVGLARKNYDNFINHLYNSTPSQQEALQGDGKPLETVGRNHNHFCHHHQHHHGHQEHPKQRKWAPESDPISSQPALKEADEGTRGHSELSKRQRIRFDKINPIYNMAALCPHGAQVQLTSPAGSSSSAPNQTAADRPMSSFGHANQALDCTADDFLDEQQFCSLCQVISCETNTCIPFKQCNNTSGMNEDSCENCHHQQEEHIMGANQSQQVDDSQQYFTCCLDRQQQRFHKQQQQLERVLTKNGSLVPQPFINPSGPPRCVSPTCQDVEREHAQQLGSDKALASLEEMAATSEEPIQKEQQQEELIAGAAGPEAGAQQTETTEKAAGERTLEPGDFFVFGETPATAPDKTIEARVRRATGSLPAPRRLAEQEQGNLNENSKTLVHVGAMGSSAAGRANESSKARTNDEAINKIDFNQRRSELASKLHLAGMSKPS